MSFDLLCVGQGGRVGHEALLLAASLRMNAPRWSGRLVVAEPQPGPLWPRDPRMDDELRAALMDLGAQIVPFESRHFGAAYPQGNKIEALACLPGDAPFLFLDSDTVVLEELEGREFDFARPSASMRREGTWPQEELYWPGYTGVWKSLYDRFGLEFETTLDLSQPDEYWRRYLYFNAGWFLGADPHAFGARFAQWAVSVRDAPTPEMAAQTLDPWLDQVVLPLVIHSFGGGRPEGDAARLDGDLTCHWRIVPLAYAREPDRVIEAIEAAAAPNKVKRVLKRHEPFLRMIYQGRGEKVRALFDRADLPRREQKIRNIIRRNGFWMR
ncbi:MAG: hypothetical protein ACU0BF_07185 [Paracoccaceae bacterium]